ncbi:MAG: alpha-2-macroglobulin family protein [Anaerolineae bacterium]|nr:alpha-2-macroglobulin family protein [Anaerolineae bacterium]
MKRLHLLGIALFTLLVVFGRSQSIGGSIGPVLHEGTPTGLQFRLSEGAEQPSPALPPLVTPTPLPESTVQAILDRLPPLPPEEAREFALPEKPLPPPRAGKTIEEPFPPQAAPIAPEQPIGDSLEVLRYQPEGDVPLAPYLSVTFSQPMVALTAHEDLTGQEVPVRLSPQPAGAWRWVGTQTLFFEPEGRFPMATHYTVEIPAGTTSAIGGKLERAVRWSFTTPPPQVQASYPTGGPHRRDVLLFVAFDQRVDPDTVLPTIQVTAGAQRFPLRLAQPEEIEADPTVRRMAKDAGEGRWLAFRATELFPADTEVTVTIGPGTPSMEGPLRTEEAQSFSFRTYGPLRVAEHRCAWGDECPPFSLWYIRFTNPLDEAKFDTSMVQVEPAVPGLRIQAIGDMLTFQGRTRGRTTYQVTLSAAITDQFGQTLGQDQTVTFTVGSAPEMITAPGGNFVVLDPYGKPTYSVFTVNYGQLNVQVYAVQPEDWPAFQTYLQGSYRTDTPSTPPGRLVLSQTIPVKAQPDELAETSIDLSPLLENGFGQFVVVVKPQPGLFATLFRFLLQRPQPVVNAWVQVTRIGLDAFVDAEEMLTWATDLRDGRPLVGVKLSLLPEGPTALTDESGMATLPLPARGTGILVAHHGADVAILPENTYWWGGGGWQRRPPLDGLQWYVFDDRQMYRPGEAVHVKGWIRRMGGGPDGDIELARDAVSRVHYRATDSQGNEIANGTLQVNLLGGFDLAFQLPEAMNLGYAWLHLTAEGAGELHGRAYTHSFQVQEFRRPEFEVSASVSEGPHFVGSYAIISVEAKYYAGGGLPNAEVAWQVTSSPGHYRPPNWDDFAFGRWIPWWEMAWNAPVVAIEGPYGLSGVSAQGVSYSGRTDAKGIHRLRIDFDAVDPPLPTNVYAEATVIDVNRQAWTAATNLLVHPAELYVGLRSPRTFVELGQPLEIEAIVVDLDGKPIPERNIAMRAVRLDWVYKNGQWQQEEVDVQTCNVLSAVEPVRCTFKTPEGGTYRITATIVDDQDRKNQTEITRWVSGDKMPPSRQIEQGKVILIPDRQTYQPGDTAEILVQAPFYPAEGLLTLRRSGLVSSERFTMDGPSYTIRVPIEERYIPNLTVQVDLVGAAPRVDEADRVDERLPQRPAFATGSLNLSVPPMQRALALEATPRETKLEPGSETVVDIRLRDANGEPVEGGEVAVVVVDEAVLALTNYQLPDPLAVFYSQRSPDVSDYHLRHNLLLVSPDQLLAMGGGGIEEPQAEGMRLFAPAAAMPTPMAPPGAGPQPIRVRLDFEALAVFAPALTTDAEGHAQVAVKLPDNLTRYRVMAVAVDPSGKRFGKAESSITARLPLMVRPSPPRFLNFGDRFELPVVVQNQTDELMWVDVAMRASNAELTAHAGYRVAVPANDRVEVRFPAATMRPGRARFQVAAVANRGDLPATGSWADAVEFSLPVWTPATTEAFATYGTLDEGAIIQPVIVPTEVFTQFGGLEITTSSTALQELTDAMLYLVSYPFECAEQLASRILAVAALRDVLTAFQAEGLPPAREIQAAVERDIERLRGMQNEDGGFPLWKRGDESWPYVTIHVAHALQRARDQDYRVPEEMVTRVAQYLRTIEDRFPSWYGQDERNALIAYSLYVRKQMGDPDMAKARQLIRSAGLEKLSPEAVGWLLYVLSGDPNSATEINAIRRYLNNRVVETAGAAHFVTNYRDQGYVLLHSDRRADGVILEALLVDQPQSDLIPKLVRGLLAHRTRGRWTNTQENVFILLALHRYFNTYEATTPDFVARVWLGDRYAGESAFRGRTTEYRQIQVPMSYLTGSGLQRLVLAKEGAGRLYYRLGLSYAPTNLWLEPVDHGFTVERVYEAVDNPDDVRRDAEGVWHVKAGARVRVRLTMVASARRYHVALVDPLPAGFEALNPALAVTGRLPQDRGGSEAYPWWAWWWPWYEHQNLRDERAEAFTSLLWEGVYSYTYVARATTPGRFIVPPAKAEEMYAPETFGRSASDWVIVE